MIDDTDKKKGEGSRGSMKRQDKCEKARVGANDTTNERGFAINRNWKLKCSKAIDDGYAVKFNNGWIVN